MDNEGCLFSIFSFLAGGVRNSIGVFIIIVVFPEQKYEGRWKGGRWAVGWASTKRGGMDGGGKQRARLGRSVRGRGPRGRRCRDVDRQADRA